MTKEEAENLKPGDIIRGGNNHNRILIKVWLVNNELHWNEERYGHDVHCHLAFIDLEIEKKAEPIVIDNYLIY